MPQRFIYRGALGRFISREEAEELGIAPIAVGPILPSDAVPHFDEGPEFKEEEGPEWHPQWQESESERGIVWSDFEPDFELENPFFAPPSDMDAYRAFVEVVDNPDYPRGMASTGWIGIDAWPPSPDMIRDVDSDGFHSIRFRRS